MGLMKTYRIRVERLTMARRIRVLRTLTTGVTEEELKGELAYYMAECPHHTIVVEEE